MVKTKKLFFIAIFLVSFSSLASCGTSQRFKYQEDKDVQILLKAAPVYPTTRFAVLSDLHFYDKVLGTGGGAFQKYVDEDRKLLLLSDEILNEAVERLSKEKLDFVLVCGDMTKDGERINHEGVVKALRKLQFSGAKVYVAPGNHDINNGNALQYNGNETKPVPGVNDKDFIALYREFG